MPFKRWPYPAMALAFLAFALLCAVASAGISSSPEDGRPLYVHLFFNDSSLDGGAVNVTVSGMPAEYLSDGTYVAMISPEYGPFNVTASYRLNNYTQTFDGLADGENDIHVDVPAWAAAHTVTGKLYTGDVNWLTTWSDDSVLVTVNGVRAEMDGVNYTAVLPAPGEADVDVKALDECGYLLSEKIVPLNESDNLTIVDMVVRPLSVYGDVYIDGIPADGSTVYIHVNDRPYEPITAEASYDDDGTLSRPMFHVLLPGAHPGDRLSLTATLGERTGSATQDTEDYAVFLTVNLNDLDTNPF